MEYLESRKKYLDPKEEIPQGTVEECTIGKGGGSVCAL